MVARHWRAWYSIQQQKLADAQEDLRAMQSLARPRHYADGARVAVVAALVAVATTVSSSR